MDFELELADGEAVVCLVEGIALHVSQEGLSKLLDSSSKAGSLYLTNQRLLFCWAEGTIKKRQQMVSINLSIIRTLDNRLQILSGTPKKLGAPFPVTVYTSDGQHTFDVPLLKKAPMDKLVEKANELLFGASPNWAPRKVTKNAKGPGVGKSIGKTISGAIGSAKPVLQNAADAAKPFVPLAAEVASAAFPGIRAVSDALSNAVSTTDNGSTQEEAPVLDNALGAPSTESSTHEGEDLSILPKLKELLDSGVLTQEEFDAKKRQLLGL